MPALYWRSDPAEQIVDLRVLDVQFVSDLREFVGQLVFVLFRPRLDVRLVIHCGSFGPTWRQRVQVWAFRVVVGPSMASMRVLPMAAVLVVLIAHRPGVFVDVVLNAVVKPRVRFPGIIEVLVVAAVVVALRQVLEVVQVLKLLEHARHLD